MALNSPGVEVSLINNTAYPQVDAGTVPLIILATAENKLNAAGTGTAIATAKVNAGKLVLTSTRQELAELYGDASFTVDSMGNPVHASETSEYGLQAAYSYAGISGSTYTLRADIDLDSLLPQANAPRGLPNDGTFWLNPAETNFGLFEAVRTSTGAIELQKREVTFISDEQYIQGNPGAKSPLSGYGVIGSYAAIVDEEETATVIKIFRRETGINWSLVGSEYWKSRRDDTSLILGTAAITSNTQLPGYGVVTFSSTTTTTISNGDTLEFTNGTDATSVQVVISDSNHQSTTANNTTTHTVTSSSLTQLGSTSNAVTGITVKKVGVNTNLATNGELKFDANLVYNITYEDGSVSTVVEEIYPSTDNTKIKTVSDVLDLINSANSNSSIAGVAASLNTINGTTRFAFYARLGATSRIASLTISTASTTSGLAGVLGLPEGVAYKTAYMQTSSHVQVPSFNAPGSVWFKSTQPNNGALVSLKLYDSINSAWSTQSCQMAAAPYEYFASNKTYQGVNIPFNSAFLLGDNLDANGKTATFKLMRCSLPTGATTSSSFTPVSDLVGRKITIKSTSGSGVVTTLPSVYVSGYPVSLVITKPNVAASFTISKGGLTTDTITASTLSDAQDAQANLLSAINVAISNANLQYISASASGTSIIITSADGVDFSLFSITDTERTDMGITSGTNSGLTESTNTVTASINYFSLILSSVNAAALTINGSAINVSGSTLADLNTSLGSNGYAISNYKMADPEGSIEVFFPSTASVSYDIATATGSTVTPGTNVSISGNVATYNRQPLTNSAIVSNINNAATAVGANYLSASIAAVGNQPVIKITNSQGGDVQFSDSIEGSLAAVGFVASSGVLYANGASIVNSRFSPLQSSSDIDTNPYFIAETTPSTTPEDGTIWYNNIAYEVDIMVNDGATWKGYRTQYPNTNPSGPFVSATQPKVHSDGTALVDNDLWIDTSDIDNYPLIKRYNSSLRDKWVIIDNTDQTTDSGIIFADARWSVSGGDIEAASIGELTVSDFVDYDAPSPALYPANMLLWNTRRSGFNVKQMKHNYVITDDENQNMGESQANYYPHRWVTISANQVDGSGSFGRKAQRAVVVKALQSAINSNDVLRDVESNRFDIIACPGYPELINEMLNLNSDRGNRSLVIGDAPARLDVTNTGLRNWANNVLNAVEDGEKGLVTHNEYLAVYTLWGMTSDNAGNNVVVPPSHAMLYTIANSDRIGAPWFAPAGPRRGLIINATSVGVVTKEGEFQTVALNEAKRDILYQANVNPVTYMDGTGLVCMGQKTRASYASAMDRVNVVRLEIILREVLQRVARQFIFEQNDSYTQQSLKSSIENVLRTFVSSRAISDFLVVCDSSNNTKARIARNELWADVAILPLRSSEFIYIPMRLDDNIGA